MKTQVMVVLRAEKTIFIEVEHDEDEDAADLTRADINRAVDEADDGQVDWYVEHAEAQT